MSDERVNPAAYQGYIGRWSGIVAAAFLAWLAVPGNALWLDVACGTGALTHAILAAAQPAKVDACDASARYIAYARRLTSDSRASFREADARALPYPSGVYDAVVAGLPFPATTDPLQVLTELARVAKPGGAVGLYLWDFDGEMQMLRYFWNAATAIDPGADEADDDERFAICKPDRLAAALRRIGLSDITVRAIDVPTRFCDFDDYWTPFSRGTAPAQKHVQSLSDERRTLLRERLRAMLPTAADGSIPLIARAWAGRGRTNPSV